MLLNKRIVVFDLRDLNHYLPYITLVFIFLINVLIIWPGQMNPDSIGQYNSAINSEYTDAHPPMMSVLWRLLDFFHKGPGLLFLFHLLLLYTALIIFISIFRESKLSWFYVIFPLLPQILFYSGGIWKDVGFAFSYLLSIAIVSFLISKNKKPGFFLILLIFFLLFYGTLIKFQAMYVLPFMLFGLVYTLNDFKINFKIFILTLFSYVYFIFLANAFNNYFVGESKKSHFWQFVKLYDLAAISLQANQELFPDFIKQNQNYSFEKIKKRFNPEQVDEIVFPKDSPLIKGKNEEERNALLNCWYYVIYQYPFFYLKHRFRNWLYIIKAMPLQKLEKLDLRKFQGIKWFANSKENLLNKLFFNFLKIIRYIFRFGFLLPFIIFYFFLGLITFSRIPKFAMPLIIMNGLNITFLFILFFFSMAGMMRYVYIVVCMVHASHPFAYFCFKELKFISRRKIL